MPTESQRGPSRDHEASPGPEMPKRFWMPRRGTEKAPQAVLMGQGLGEPGKAKEARAKSPRRLSAMP
jgi:hypothetical protein